MVRTNLFSDSLAGFAPRKARRLPLACKIPTGGVYLKISELFLMKIWIANFDCRAAYKFYNFQLYFSVLYEKALKSTLTIV